MSRKTNPESNRTKGHKTPKRPLRRTPENSAVDGGASRFPETNAEDVAARLKERARRRRAKAIARKARRGGKA